MSNYRETDPQSIHQTSAPSAWVGWIGFAGVMLVLLGAFHAIQGLVAILNDDQYLVGSGGLVVHVDYTAWGWTHLIAGAVAIFAGFGLFKGQTWARVVGVIFAVLSAIVNVGFLPAYPIWSVLMIGLDIIIIMALTVHGSEMKAAR